MKITGTFKSYEDLLQIYGTDTSKEIDNNFNKFLKKIANKDCVLCNYRPVLKTFDASLLVDKTDKNGNTIKVMEILDPFIRRYTENISIDTLDSYNCDGCDDVIYCTGCGAQFPKKAKHDNVPEFTWGRIFDGDCSDDDTDNQSLTTVYIRLCTDDGRLYCPFCRRHHKFKEISDSFN